VTGGANVSQMNAIFGGLVQLVTMPDGSDAQVVGVLASRYELIDGGRALVLHLRPDVTFSDGTPFNAEAVKFNIERSLQAPCSCSTTTWPWAKEPVTTRDDRTLILHFTRPFASVVTTLAAANINWIASPTALRRMGPDQFKITPVGAGPFRVVSNQLSSRLVLERNPRYWQEGRPYLDRLIFQSIGSEQAGLQAVLAGNAQAFENLTSIALLQQARANKLLTVTLQPPTSPMVIQLNTQRPPFDDIRAREAIYFATDSEAIRNGLFKGWYPISQSFTAPGGLYHRERIDGYRVHDLAKARALVARLGKFEVTLGSIRTPVTEQVITALQTQWQEAGIKVNLESYDLGQLISCFQSRDWHALLQTAGSYDPEAGPGLGFRFRSTARFSGVQDPDLDRLLDLGAATVDPQARSRIYHEVGRYISDKAYAPFLLAQVRAQVARGLHGPGLTTRVPPIAVSTAILWQDVWRAQD
jgi:peptide/nickel transport system substrate-binding protein